MSDRFASAKVRENLLARFSKEKREVDLYPKPPSEPEVEEFNSTNVGKRCGNYQLKLLEPLALPSVVDEVDGFKIESEHFWGSSTLSGVYGKNVKGQLKLTRYSEMAVEEGYSPVVPETLYLPVGPKKLPRYVPSSKFYTYSEETYKQVFHNYLVGEGFGTKQVKSGSSKEMIEVEPTNDDVDGDEFRELYITCENSFVGMAPWPTQLVRLGKLYKVNYGNGFNKVKSFREQGIDLEYVLQLLQTTLPLGQVDHEAVTLLNKPSDYVQAFYNGDSLEIVDGTPKIRDQSLAGLPFEQHKKKELTKWSSLTIADLVYAKVFEKVQAFTASGTSVFEYSDAIKSVLEEFPFLLVNYMIPKNERYTLGDNTRNIVAVSTVSHYLASKITAPLGAGEPINAANSLGCVSLHGFSAVKGNLERFVMGSVMPDWEDKVRYWIYADNIYVCHRGDWYSLDLEKGESQATRDVACAVGWHFLRNWYQSTNPETLETTLHHNRTWAVIATVLIPTLFVDSSVVYSNKRIKWPGQLSGNSWTFYINHVVSSMIMDALVKAGDPVPGSPSFDSVMKKGGWNIKVEKKIKGFCRQVQALVDDDSVPDFSSHGDVNFPRIDMDFLGWSACFAKVSGVVRILPALDEVRFRKTLMLPKKRVEGTGATEKALGSVLDKAHANVQLQALVMIGGWSRRLWARTVNQRLVTTASGYYSQLGKFETNPDLNFKSLLPELPLDFEGLSVINSVKRTLTSDFLINLLLGDGSVPIEPDQAYNTLSSADTILTTNYFVYKSKSSLERHNEVGWDEATSWADAAEADESSRKIIVQGDYTGVFKSIREIVRLFRSPLDTVQPFDDEMARKGPDVFKNYKVVYDDHGILSEGKLTRTRADVTVGDFLAQAVIKDVRRSSSKRVEQRRKAKQKSSNSGGKVRREVREDPRHFLRPMRYSKRDPFNINDAYSYDQIDEQQNYIYGYDDGEALAGLDDLSIW